LLPNGIAPYADATAKALAELTRPGAIALVVAERLPRHVRTALEEAGVSYADGRGAVHLEAPGLLLHIDGPTKAGTVPAPSGIGVVGVRLVQTLLADRERDWSVTELAKRAQASAGGAHNIFQRLETEGLVTTTGRGRARTRRIVNASDVLDWLARVPSARRMRERVQAFLYAANPDMVITELSARAHEADVEYAVTGAAGARVLGTRAVTALDRVMVRVVAPSGLQHVVEDLGAEAVDAGANLLLVLDTGSLGTHGRVRNGPVFVAQPERVWLDMLDEPRGEDAAALFREAVLGY
jgi:hypothetical protein